MPRSGRRFAAIYVVWTAVCAVLFLALRGAEDPSRREGRILNLRAGSYALATLRGIDRDRFADYEVVHVAFAGRPDRWIVLADRNPHTGLKEAVVVELDAKSGRTLRIRRPEG